MILDGLLSLHTDLHISTEFISFKCIPDRELSGRTLNKSTFHFGKSSGIVWTSPSPPLLLLSLFAVTSECLDDPAEGGWGVRKAGKGQGGLGYIRVGGWSSRVAWGCGASSNRAVSRGSPHSRCWPVVWWKLHVCWSLSAGGTPRGGVGGVRGMVGSRQENVFLSPVILHNAGQIRLELTAEDIQLDCARHSVASIRASSCVFVFPAAEREKAACTVFLCHFHLCLWISSLYVSQNITC